MKAGKLRHKVTIEWPGTSSDGYGIRDDWDSPTTFEVVWAAIEPLSGREFFQAQQAAPESRAVSHRIRTRYLAGVTNRMRIRSGSRLFDIEAVLNVQERNRELHLMCVESVA